MSATSPSAAFVHQLIEASGARGCTFAAIVKDARLCWSAADEDQLRGFLAELVTAGQVVVHPQLPDRYILTVVRDSFPIELHRIEGATLLANFARQLFAVTREHAAAVMADETAAGASASLTIDHIDFITDGQTRTLVIYDRPVHPFRPGTAHSFPRI